MVIRAVIEYTQAREICFLFTEEDTARVNGIENLDFMLKTMEDVHPDYLIEDSDPDSNIDNVLEFAIRYDEGTLDLALTEE